MSRNARKRAGRKDSFNTKTTRMSKIVGWSAALLLAKLSNVEVTVRYHLMTHTLFLAIVCLTTYFHYLFITYHRLSGNINLVAIE